MKTEIKMNSTGGETPYSPALLMNQQLYVSGQLPVDPETNTIPEDIAGQTKLCMENLKALVEKAGLSMDDVVKTTVYMTDFSHFSEMNAMYRQYFTKPYPARCACEVSGLARGAAVEIECIAVAQKPDAKSA